MKRITLLLSICIVVLMSITFSGCIKIDNNYYAPLSIDDLTITHTNDRNKFTVTISTTEQYFVTKNFEFHIDFFDVDGNDALIHTDKFNLSKGTYSYTKDLSTIQQFIYYGNGDTRNGYYYDEVIQFQLSITKGLIAIKPDMAYLYTNRPTQTQLIDIY